MAGASHPFKKPNFSNHSLGELHLEFLKPTGSDAAHVADPPAGPEHRALPGIHTAVAL